MDAFGFGPLTSDDTPRGNVPPIALESNRPSPAHSAASVHASDPLNDLSPHIERLGDALEGLARRMFGGGR